jgi:hypothetical protein
MGRHVERMEKIRNEYKILVANSEGTRPIGRSSYRWKDNIKMDLRDIGLEGVGWIHLATDRDWWRVKTVMNLRVP